MNSAHGQKQPRPKFLSPFLQPLIRGSMRETHLETKEYWAEGSGTKVFVLSVSWEGMNA